MNLRPPIAAGQTWRHKDCGREAWVTGRRTDGRWVLLWPSGQKSELRDLTIWSNYVLVGRWQTPVAETSAARSGEQLCPITTPPYA